MLKLPDGTVKVLVEGLQRARISALSDNGEHFSAKAEYLESPTIDEREQEVLVRTAISQFEGYIKLNEKIHQNIAALKESHRRCQGAYGRYHYWRIPAETG